MWFRVAPYKYDKICISINYKQWFHMIRRCKVSFGTKGRTFRFGSSSGSGWFTILQCLTTITLPLIYSKV
eukprot:jgi/Botrbrau1/2419/Bobra.0395s0044.1